MPKMRLRVAELRRKKHISQQQLADVVGVSFQTISKWENGNAMPDITNLPILAEYFNVSVDQLLGLVPLQEEKYIPTTTESADFWAEKFEYLIRSRKNSWNDDYARFLIETVWKIDRPVKVLDCGCGLGFLGKLFMPYLPKGSSYTGIDVTEKLTEVGENLFADVDYPVRFITKNVMDYQAKEKYDLVLCKAVLRHLNDPNAFLAKIIEFAKRDALIVCIDSNRELECDGLYVDGMDYFELCNRNGIEKHWKTELEQQGRDYAVAIRTAHMMRSLGLREVDVRMNDKVNFVTPQLDDYEEIKQDFLKYNDWNAGLSSKQREDTILFFTSHGMTRQEAERNIDRNIEISKFFSEHPDAGYTFFKGTMISYGKK